MALAVVRAWRKEATSVEIYIETKFACGRNELRIKLVFVVTIHEGIKRDKVIFNGGVNPGKDAIACSSIDIRYPPGPRGPILGGLLISHCFAVSSEFFL